MNGRLAGKVLFVGGAAGGIGAAVSRACLAEGARIVCADLDSVGLEQLVRSFDVSTERVRAIQVDFRQFEPCVQAVQEAVSWAGGIDGLIAVAGGSHGERIPFLEMQPALWRAMIDRNLTATFNLSLAAAQAIVRRGGGTIVLTASQLGLVVEAGAAHYASAKAAVIQLAKAMAVDLAEFGIRVNAIAPGTTLTPATSGYFGRPEVLERHRVLIPLRRHARPDEISGAAIYLSSPESSYTTGSTVVIDGGYSVV